MTTNGAAFSDHPMVTHDGNGCPVARDAVVTVRLRSGNVRYRHRADYWDWWHSNHSGDVVAYVVKQPA